MLDEYLGRKSFGFFAIPKVEIKMEQEKEPIYQLFEQFDCV